MLTPALDPVFIAYNTGASGRILHTICIVRKYFTQEPDSKARNARSAGRPEDLPRPGYRANESSAFVNLHWSFEQGVFRYFEHPGHLAPEKALEGKYVTQTEEPDLSAAQAVEAYKDLSEVERSFRQLKDLIEMRPFNIGDPNGCGRTFSSQRWPSCWLARWRKNSRPPGCRCPAPRHWKPCALCMSLTSESVQRSDAE